MIFRFCLYGFLKNQRYFEPFLLLVFLDRGLSFTVIGMLIGFRDACVFAMELPTGAIADVLGRRKAMIVSFLGYIASFLVFAASASVPLLFAAMFLFALGDAFRTGTHKAIIFDWLAHEGRTDEKTKIYGLTRSWSKLGSAASVVIAAGIMFVTDNYAWVFYLCVVPYMLNIINFMFYPAALDGPRRENASLSIMVRTLTSALKTTIRSMRLRRLLAESVGYELPFKISKDYLQAVIQTAALAIPVLISLDDHQRVALMIGGVYFCLHLVSSFASRNAGRLSSRAGNDDRAATTLWLLNTATYGLLAAGIFTGWDAVTISAFVVLAGLQNLWRPIQVSRYSEDAPADSMATMLSVESETRSLFVAGVAPLLGWTVDVVRSQDASLQFMPVAILGLAVSLILLITNRRKGERT